jgi:hypothetical protein
MKRLLPSLPLFLSIILFSAGLVADPLADFNTKATILIDWVADVYATPGGFNPYDDQTDPEKYTGPKMTARFFKYGPADAAGEPLGASPPNAVNANEWLKEGIGYLNLFHFRYLGLAGNLARFGDAPGASGVHASVMINGVPMDVTYADSYIEAVLTREDNYNAFTGEGTENHFTMNRTSAWIFARLAQESPYYTARHADNPANYPDPYALEARMRDTLTAWAQKLYQVGSAEYDSSVYSVFNIVPWINLYEATLMDNLDDPDLNSVARAVLDWYAAATALKYRYGIFNGASVRGEAVVDRYDRDDESDFLTWLWFGHPADVPTELANSTVRTENQPIQAVYAATSSYRPPATAVALAQKSGMENTLTRHGRPNYLMNTASESLEQFFIGPDYTLGSAQFPYGGWASSIFRTNMWKLVADMGTYTPAVITGNNGFRTAGSGWMFRNPWVQVVQDCNVVLQLNVIPSNAATLYSDAMSLIRDVWLEDWYDDFTSRWSSPDWGGFQGDLANSGDTTPVKAEENGSVSSARTSYVYMERAPSEAVLDSGVYFVRFGTVYLAVRSVDGDTPVYNAGSRHFSDISNYDALGGLIIETGSGSDPDYADFAAFRAFYLANSSLSVSGLTVTYTAMDGRVITATYESSGGYTEPEYDWAYGVTEPVEQYFLDTYETGVSPPESWTLPAFPTGTGTGRVASWTVDADGGGPQPPVAYGASTIWPVFDGPNIRQMNGVLHVWDGTELHTVDYSGSAPLISSGSIPVPVTSISLQNGEAIIEWPTLTGLSYQLYRADSLDGPWSPVGDAFIGDGLVNLINGGPVASPGAAFWRVVVLL